MIKSVRVTKVTVALAPAKGTIGQTNYIPAHKSAEAEYVLLDDRGVPTGATGKLAVFSNEARNLTESLWADLEEKLGEFLLGIEATSSTQSNEVPPLVPITKE